MTRPENTIRRVLRFAGSLAIALIADVHYLARLVLRALLRGSQTKTINIVSNAIRAAGLRPGDYRVGNLTVHVGRAAACWAAYRVRFGGSEATLPRMRSLLTCIGTRESQADSWPNANASRLLGLASG